VQTFIEERPGSSRKAMAYSAAAMYGGAALAGTVEHFIPGGPHFALTSNFIAFGVVALLLLVGPRLPMPAIVLLGPIGVSLIALAVATTNGPGDTAVLYVWPVLWQSYYFGRRGTILIVAWVGVAHALALQSLPADIGYPDRWVDVMVTMVVVGAVVDLLSERNERLVRRLAAEARVDGLTGLLNRRGFGEAGRAELSRALRSGATLGIVSFDIDHFKAVNDEFGHDAGDKVLVRLGRIFREQTRDGDLVARMGGEEFVALLVDSDVKEAVEYAERMRAAFAVAAPGLPQSTLSAGVTAVTSPVELQPHLQLADAALYAAKRAGRNQTVIDSRLAPEPAVRG
jgi:diguanylate cyclase (GGDEF)-like protein